ncbi:MAG: HPP family protein [Candidatus Bathyarchaeia archaeon]
MPRKNIRQEVERKGVVSFLAGITILLTFLLVDFVANLVEYGIILASLGATAFLVFVYPGHKTSRLENVVGGYVLSCLSGGLAQLLLSKFLPLAAALSVGLSVFLMLIFKFEHPPASGIALSFALYALSLQEIASVLVGLTIFLILTALLTKTIREIAIAP